MVVPKRLQVSWAWSPGIVSGPTVDPQGGPHLGLVPMGLLWVGGRGLGRSVSACGILPGGSIWFLSFLPSFRGAWRTWTKKSGQGCKLMSERHGLDFSGGFLVQRKTEGKDWGGWGWEVQGSEEGGGQSTFMTTVS